jgi:hypothetical protein
LGPFPAEFYQPATLKKLRQIPDSLHQKPSGNCQTGAPATFPVKAVQFSAGGRNPSEHIENICNIWCVTHTSFVAAQALP